MQHSNTGGKKELISVISLMVITLLFACTFNAASGQNKATQITAAAPTQLRVDLTIHPERVYKNGYPTNISLQSITAINSKFLQYSSINSSHPGFSWVVPITITKQTAYQLLLATSREALDNRQSTSITDFGWNSGQQISEQNINVRYTGPSLKPNTVYYWKVRVWGESAGKASRIRQSTFSAVQTFRTGAKLTAGALPGFVLTKTRQKPLSHKDLSMDYRLYDFGKDGFSQPIVSIRAAKDDTIQLLLGEQLDASHRINRTPPGTVRFRQIVLPVKKGTHNYRIPIESDKRNTKRSAIKMPAYIGEVLPFRYLAIQGDLSKNVPVAVTRDLIHIPFDQKTTNFTSSDSVLNQVWDLCKYTIEATSFSGYYVDGDRERIPYEADALINQLSGYSTAAIFNMAKRTLNYLVYHPTWPTEWSLQNPMIAYNDYMYSGDPRNLANIYKDLQPKVLTALEDSNGLISTRTGKQSPGFLQSIHYKVFDGNPGLKDIVDWPHTKEETDGFVFTDYNAVVNAYYYKALKDMALLAAAIHKSKDADDYRQRAANVKKAYLKHFINPSTGLIIDGIGTQHSSLHANMFALAFGLVPKNNLQKVLAFIKSRGVSCSVYGAQFLLEALGEKDHSDYALKLLTSQKKRSWYNMIVEGATMTMEAWGQKFKPNQDWNHAWGTAPANYIVRYLMGITPLKPGFQEILIRPHPGTLDSAGIEYPTVRGIISVSFKKSAETFTLQAAIPGNTTARICLPTLSREPAVITMDGQQIKASLDPDGRYWEIPAVMAGQHTFKVQRQ
ncbi:hypothetical protein GCM10027566_36760 [Arachidicoccus ginsenosidivorans]